MRAIVAGLILVVIGMGLRLWQREQVIAGLEERARAAEFDLKSANDALLQLNRMNSK